MKQIIFLLLAIIGMASGTLAQEKLDVIRKDSIVLIVNSTGNEMPITSAQLASDYDATDAIIKTMTERRERLAQLLKLDEELEKAKTLQDMRRQIFPKVRAIEADIQADIQAETQKGKEPPHNKQK